MATQQAEPEQDPYEDPCVAKAAVVGDSSGSEPIISWPG